MQKLLAVSRLHVVLLALSVSATAACDQQDMTPFEVVIGSAAPLGFAGALAMAAIDGRNPACTVSQGTCGAFPCVASVDIEVSAACPLPFGADLRGTILVDGAWSSIDDAILSVDVSDISELRFEGAAGLVTSFNDDKTELIWAEQPVEVDDEGASVEQSAVTIEVTHNETPAFDDDTVVLLGARQVVDDGEIQQIVLTDVTFTPACRENPTSGNALMQAAGGEIPIEYASLEFHDACDGRATVGTALDIPFVDNTVALTLTDDGA